MTGSLLWTHGNRMVFHHFLTHATDSLWFRSGIRQEYSLVGDTAATLVDVANIRQQFIDHKRHRIITCNWIGFNHLLLL